MSVTIRGHKGRYSGYRNATLSIHRETNGAPGGVDPGPVPERGVFSSDVIIPTIPETDPGCAAVCPWP